MVDKIIMIMDATNRERDIRRKQKEILEIKTPKVKSFTDSLISRLATKKTSVSLKMH